MRLRALSTCLALALAVCAGQAHAHASLVKSDPGRRAVLKSAPKAVKLWFSEKLEPAYSSAWLVDARGERVNRQPGAVSTEDPKLIVLPLEALPPGAYRVQYRVLSVDGHVIESSYLFTLKPAP